MTTKGVMLASEPAIGAAPPDGQSKPLLTITDLDVRYGQIRALRGVSLAVPEGSVVALLGANGAGKSTVLRAISGLLRPHGGSIVYDGVPIGRRPPDELVRRGISHAPEGRQVFPELTVRENLRLGAYTRRERTAWLAGSERVYAYFGRLRERREQLAGTLSGGEQQMLAIGRALMAAPRLLLLDEPSLGLAPLLVKEIFAIIQEIRAAGTTVLLVEQNVHLALAIADYGYVLETGRVAIAGRADQLRQREEVRRSYLGR